jgi:hypothetical protein
MTNAIEAVGLGKRYGRRWALQDCTVNVPSSSAAKVAEALLAT